MNTREVITSGGELEDKGQPWIVSFWYIPGGYRYDHAEVVTAYFDDKEAAVSFEKRNEMVPVMASLLSREDLNKIRQNIKELDTPAEHS